METIRIRKAGYPMRHQFDYFHRRYRMLLVQILSSSTSDKAKLSTKNLDPKQATKLICQHFLGSGADWQMGNTKVFLKDTHDSFLERKRDELITINVIKLQNWFRMNTSKRKFFYTRKSAIKIQSWYRMVRQRRLYLKVRKGFCRFQSTVRSRKLARLYATKLQYIIHLQAMCRGKMAREKFKADKEASGTVRIQIKHLDVNTQKDLLLEMERRKEQLWVQKNIDEIRLRKELGDSLQAEKEATKMYKQKMQNLRKELLENPDLKPAPRNSARSSIRSEMSINLSGDTNNLELLAPPEAFQDLENPEGSFSSNHSNDNHSSIGDSSSLNRSNYTEYQFSKFAITYFQVSCTSF